MKHQHILFIGTSCALLAISQATWASVYKCEVNGKKAEYQFMPCTSGKSTTINVVTTSPTVAPAQAKSPLDNKLSINLPNTRLSVVLQIVADFAGYALIVNPAITDDGNFNYKNTPASAILSDLAARHGLRIKTDNRTITVARR